MKIFKAFLLISCFLIIISGCTRLEDNDPRMKDHQEAVEKGKKRTSFINRVGSDQATTTKTDTANSADEKNEAKNKSSKSILDRFNKKDDTKSETSKETNDAKSTNKQDTAKKNKAAKNNNSDVNKRTSVNSDKTDQRSTKNSSVNTTNTSRKSNTTNRLNQNKTTSSTNTSGNAGIGIKTEGNSVKDRLNINKRPPVSKTDNKEQDTINNEATEKEKLDNIKMKVDSIENAIDQLEQEEKGALKKAVEKTGDATKNAAAKTKALIQKTGNAVKDANPLKKNDPSEEKTEEDND